MVVDEVVEDIAIVSNGSGGYLVVQILERCETYAEAQEAMEIALDQDEDEEDDAVGIPNEEDEEDEEDDSNED